MGYGFINTYSSYFLTISYFFKYVFKYLFIFTYYVYAPWIITYTYIFVLLYVKSYLLV